LLHTFTNTAKGDTFELDPGEQALLSHLHLLDRYACLSADHLYDEAVFLIAVSFHFLPQSLEDLSVAAGLVGVVVREKDLGLDVAAYVEHYSIIAFLFDCTSKDNIKK